MAEKLQTSDDSEMLDILGVEFEVNAKDYVSNWYKKHPSLQQISGRDPYWGYLAHVAVWLAAAGGSGAVGNAVYDAAKSCIKDFVKRRKNQSDASLTDFEAYALATYAAVIYQHTKQHWPPEYFTFEPVSALQSSGEWIVVLDRTHWFDGQRMLDGSIQVRINAQLPSLHNTHVMEWRIGSEGAREPQWVEMPKYLWQDRRSEIEEQAIMIARLYYWRPKNRYSFELVNSSLLGDYWYVDLWRSRPKGKNMESDRIVRVKIPIDAYDSFDLDGDDRFEIADENSEWVPYRCRGASYRDRGSKRS